MSEDTPTIEIIEAIDDQMSDYIRLMMRNDFDTEVGLVRDPETDDVILTNLDGSDVNEGQQYALAFFERGWFSALQAVGTLAERFDKTIGLVYTDENDNPQTQEDE